jgi:hypothetical protein
MDLFDYWTFRCLRFTRLRIKVDNAKFRYLGGNGVGLLVDRFLHKD